MHSYLDHSSVLVFISSAPGSGKSLFSRYLVDNLKAAGYDVSYAIMSQLLEQSFPEEMKKQDVELGGLLDDEFPIQVARHFIRSVTPGGFIICDGFLRRKRQATEILRQNRYKGKQVSIMLDIPEEESLERLKGRAFKENRADDRGGESVSKRRINIFNSTIDDIQTVIEGEGVQHIILDASVEGVENVFQQLLETENTISDFLQRKTESMY